MSVPKVARSSQRSFLLSPCLSGNYVRPAPRCFVLAPFVAQRFSNAVALWYYQKAPDHADPTERIVADVLQQLDEGWTIRWGWYYEDNSGVQREGDFLIQSPQGHMLVLEVKATALRNFVLTGRWESNGNFNPLDQLYAQWQSVIAQLKEDAPGEELPFVGYAFALPNLQLLPDDRPGGVLKKSMVLDRSSLNQFTTWWREHFGGRPVRGKDHRKRFVRLFAAGLQPAQLNLFIRNTEVIFSRFRGTEFDLLKRVYPNQQLLVHGGPGTSKTFMALRMAELIAGEGPGREVLFLCYNRALGESLREMVEGMQLERGTIHVMTWEAIARHVLEEIEVTLEVPEDPRQKTMFYDEELLGYLQIALHEGQIKPRYDALIVDEAQDIDTRLASTPNERDGVGGWWGILFALLRSGASARMAIFFDPAQRADFRHNRFAIDDIVPHLSQPAFIRLNRSVRYTAPIFRFLIEVAGDPRHPIFEGLELHPQAPQGPEVVRVAAEPSQTRSAVERILKQWLKLGLCKERDICILGPRSSLQTSSLGGVSEILSRPLIDYPVSGSAVPSTSSTANGENQPKASADSIRYLSLHRAKGLDFLAVILIDEPCQPATSFILAASRARQLLAVVEPTVTPAT